MEISILLMEQITELFLMILMGYIIVKTGLLKGEDSKVISISSYSVCDHQCISGGLYE